MEYTLLTEQTVASYIAGRPTLAGRVDPSTLTVREVGDGNLNLVFICSNGDDRSLVLKQSLPHVRVDPSWPLTADRSSHEARGLRVAHAASPKTGPELYEYNHDQHVVAMEDLSGLTVWRTELVNGDVVEGVDALCGRHVARLAFASSIFGMEPEAFRTQRSEALNPDLCRITEDLIFTEPLIDHEHNSVPDRTVATLDELRSDPAARAEVSRLKTEFMTRAEALLHGDLHTGSVMVGTDDGGTVAKVIDTEFGCYGPVAFDLGVLIGNMLLAHGRAVILGDNAQATWLAGAPERIVTAFTEEFHRLWPTRVDTSFGDDVAATWLARVQTDSVGFAACEAIRRIVGFAKVADMESLPESQRSEATSMVLAKARAMLADPPTAIDPTLFTRS